MNAAKEYAVSLAVSLTKITMTAFFVAIHERFYPTQDISFMEYFLELTEHEDEFVVHHSKLREYGIMTSTQSSDAGKKLNSLDLIENVDFELRDISELRTQGGTGTKHVYYLTPEAFKKCLMRARRYANQPVDPVIYCNYYLLLEKTHRLYTMYERLYSEKLVSMKDDKIDRLEKKMDEQTAKMDEIKSQNTSLAADNVGLNVRLEKLLGYAEKTTNKLDETNIKLDQAQDDLTEVKEEVTIAKSFLEEKSTTSTMNPEDETKHHYFAVTSAKIANDTVVTFTTGQYDYVRRTIDDKETAGSKILMEPFYNANGIDLRQNVHAEFKKVRREVVAAINEERKTEMDERNETIREEIKLHNENNPKDKRRFMDEKRTTFKRVNLKDIPIKFCKLKFTYTPNDYMSFEDVFGIVKRVNETTQTSPMPSPVKKERKTVD